MRAPLSWLRELVDVPAGATGEQVAADLVRVGLEEEGLHGGDVTGPVVVGRIESAEPEPQKNGKTISWCSVDVGEGLPRGIVCGAPNAVAGALVVVALPGAVLPGPFAISARKTYGHVSDGMICSARELGLGDEHDGIVHLDELLGAEAADAAAPGQDALRLLGLAEEVVEVNVTPDRGYCFSLRGLAREYAHGARLDVATAFRDPALAPVVAPVAGDPLAVLADAAPIAGAAGCTRFAARLVRGIDPAAPSPWWVRRRLQQSGVRPISLAVDVTNYVMLELGQPLHAYDAAAVRGPLHVRRARPGERLTTLDDVDRRLDAEDLVIADGPQGERAIGLAGVMGGASTEVGPRTRDVLVEAATFDPVTIARTARRHKLPSEASRRFERGVDPALAPAAAQRVVDLLVEHGGGKADDGAVTDVVDPAARDQPPVVLPADLPSRVVGLELPTSRVAELLEQVGCRVEPVTGAAPSTGGAGAAALRVTPPTWRPDLTLPADLVEEVARLHGYDAIPSVLPSAPVGRGRTPAQAARLRVATALAGAGLVEALTYPFASAARADELGLAPDDPRRTAVRLANPLSEEAPLVRTSVLATLVDAVRRNTARGAADVALYEIGSVALPVVAVEAAEPAPAVGTRGRPPAEQLAALQAVVPPQPLHLAVVATGAAQPAGWAGPARPWDALDAVALAQVAARAVGVELAVAQATREPWHPGRCAALALPDGRAVGHAGELHPAVVAALDLPPRAVALELDLDALVAAAPDVVLAPTLSAYPVAKEDLALVVDAGVPAAAVRDAVLAGLAAAGLADLVEEVRLFDVYTGAPVPSGSRSLAFALRLRGRDRTLTAQDTASARAAALSGAARVGAVLRGA